MPTPDDASDRELADAALAARLLAALAPTGAVTCRRLGALRAMFHPASGTDAPFGFVLRAEAYFKAGPDTVTKFIARGMSPYRPADVRQPLRGYWRVPPDVLGDEQRGRGRQGDGETRRKGARC